MHVLPFVAVMFLLGCETRPPAAGAQQAPANDQRAPTSGEPRPREMPPPTPGAPQPAVTVEQAPASGQQAQSRTPRAPLCLDLNAPRDKVQLGEPLSLVVSLINCSSETQTVDDLLSPEFGFLQILIQPPAGKEQLYRPVTKRDARGKRTRSLAPGARLAALAPVYVSADGWTMTRPGRYGFRAQYSVGAKLESKPVEVNVAAPQSEADRQAATIMISPEVGWFLLTGRDDKGESSKRLTAVVEQYPQSRLAPYARVGVAIAESRDRFDPSTKQFRREGCQRAAGDLAHAPEIADPSLASAGTAAWIRCLRQMGRDKEVDGAISSFLRLHPAAKDVTAVNQMFGATRQE